ncbi:hypothetical protein, partial [Vibrio parahaemolyticus]|uniref:hypothetical protein n=1 Tax=Vibrio parahaemolyticus TaxID=670 RepID=UPI001BAE6B94
FGLEITFSCVQLQWLKSSKSDDKSIITLYRVCYRCLGLFAHSGIRTKVRKECKYSRNFTSQVRHLSKK